MSDEIEKSLSDEATLAGNKQQPARAGSIGDERTLGGADAAGIDAVMDDIEVVDLEARYTIEGTLGQGGMGAVLLATDTRLGRKVAIKRILGEAAGNRLAAQRFLTEAKAIAAIGDHPNIVQIYDYGRAKDGPFLIMEYVDGGSLAEKCKAGALPLEEVIDIACQACEALAKAHGFGVIHRDIKPANVLLTKDGVPKLTDFGLAKADSSDHHMTMTGAVMGTPDFMPPEQRRDAAEVDARSDLWSLAATVYQMVTGRSPKVIRLHEVPQSLQAVLAKALEDRKDDRYQAAKEFRDALRATSVDAKTPSIHLVQGQCPSCGAENESNRRFCRSCAEPLEAACLSCSVRMPLWEDICGQCGGKQSVMVEERRAQMAVLQSEAVDALQLLHYETALRKAETLREEPHPKLRHLSEWAIEFLETIAAHREQQTERALSAIEEASKHEAAHDYNAAIATLEALPDRMKAEPLPGQKVSVEATLENLRDFRSTIQLLESSIKQRVSLKQLDDLLPDVEKLLELLPGRSDVQKLCSQLRDRLKKQTVARDQAIATARQRMDEQDYEGAVDVLALIPANAVTAKVKEVRAVAKIERLYASVKDAVKSRKFGTAASMLSAAASLENAPPGVVQDLLLRRKEVVDLRRVEATNIWYSTIVWCVIFLFGGPFFAGPALIIPYGFFIAIEAEPPPWLGWLFIVFWAFPIVMKMYFGVAGIKRLNR